MIAPDVQIELDKLRTRLDKLERERRNAATMQEVDRVVDSLRGELRPELDALKRRAG